MDAITPPCGTPAEDTGSMKDRGMEASENSVKSSGESRKSSIKSFKNEEEHKTEKKTENTPVKVSFESRTVYDATENLLNTRSESYKIRKPPRIYGLLNKPPPDFRPQAYRPQPPKRNTRDAVEPWKYATELDDYYEEGLQERKKTLHLPKVLAVRRDEDDKFFAGYVPIDAHDDRANQAGETGHLKRNMYKMPQLHDFRGYPSLKSLGLPEFCTSYERDPYNNKLHTRSQRTILGPPPQIVKREIEFGHFVPALHQPPKWEVRLHHPHDPFPNRPASYTRFRRTGRDPHSAFMEKVTETIDSIWSRERRQNDKQRHQRTATES